MTTVIFLGLGEGEDFKHLVERAEAAGKDDQRLGEIGEPELAHEEVMELEVERGGDVRVGMLLEGQADVEAHGFAAGLVCASVGGFHDAGATAAGDDEAMTARGYLFGPGGEHMGELAGVFVVASHFDGGLGALELQLRGLTGGDLRGLGGLLVAGRGLHGAGVFQEFQFMAGFFATVKARRAEEDDGVLNLLAAEAGERLHVLGDDADEAAIGAVEEGGVLIGQRGGFELRGRAVA
jgi:hypothetical protein